MEANFILKVPTVPKQLMMIFEREKVGRPVLLFNIYLYSMSFFSCFKEILQNLAILYALNVQKNIVIIIIHIRYTT